MADRIPDFTRRKALAALATVGAGSAAVGAGAFAAFSDTESSSDGLSTGSLLLDKGNQTLSFTSSNILPGDSGSSSVVLKSTGTNGGRLDITIANVNNTDDASTTPEEDAEGGTNVPLSEALEVKMFVEEASPNNGSEGSFDPSYDYGLKSDGNVAHGSGASLSYATVAQYPTNSAYQTATFADSGATDKEFFVKWRLPSDASNAVQRDSTTIDFDLTLNSN